MVAVEHLTKYYGDHPAVHDLSFEFAGSGVYGLLGPNGAGKSTTMNIMTGCLSATEGRVLIDGHDIYEEPEAAKKLIGYLPEQPPLYLNETPEEYLKFVGEAKGLKGKALKDGVDEAVSLTGIEAVKDRLMSSLSKGYKQRVGIAQALIGNPKVIILDEPTVGLDPIQIIEIRELIRNLGEDHTVILSSHILSEVQMVCGEVLIISDGRLVAFDTPDGLEKHMMGQGAVTFTAETSAKKAAEILKDICGAYECVYEEHEEEPSAAKGEGTVGTDEGVPAVTQGGASVTVTVRTDPDDIRAVSRSIFFAFAGAGIALIELASEKASLEDVFLELTEAGPVDPGQQREPLGEPFAAESGTQSDCGAAGTPVEASGGTMPGEAIYNEGKEEEL